MQKTTRQRLFYALVALFLVIGSGVVFYADGWHWDFSNWRPEKVGEVYIRPYPSDVAISLNGEPVKNQSGFLSRGTLIPDLLPRTYNLTLTHSDYEPWHELAAVLPTLVTEFNYAVLVPQNATTVATDSVEAVALTAAGPVLQTARGVIMNGDLSLGVGTIESADPRTSAIIIRRPSGAYVLRDVAASTTLNLSNLFLANDVNLALPSFSGENLGGRGTATAVGVSPYDTTFATAGNQSNVWLMNLATQGLVYAQKAPNGYVFGPPVALPSGAAWSAFRASANVSLIQWYNGTSGLAEQSSSTVPGQTVRCSYIAGSTLAVLQNDGELYRYDMGTDKFTKIADDVVDFSASPDGTMLAAAERASMEIFSSAPTDPSNSYWRFNLRDARDIKNLAWYRDDRHLFVVYPDHVAFLDLADSALANFTTVTQGSSAAYDSSGNALYLVDPQKNLVRFDFPR